MAILPQKDKNLPFWLVFILSKLIKDFRRQGGQGQKNHAKLI